MYQSDILRDASSEPLELKIVLDFDGVLFNSAFEAFSVCNLATAGLPGMREVDFEEFLRFRAFVTDAWQYRRLYDSAVYGPQFGSLHSVGPDQGDWDFAKRFFNTRQRMMADPDWPKVMAPYDFFFLLRPLLTQYPDRFHVLSTRDVTSLRRTLEFYGAGQVQVCGQEDIRRAGSKIEVAREMGWVDNVQKLVVYVDDMSGHLEPFEGKVHLPLHANWGYDASAERSLGQHQVLSIIQSMLKLAPHE